MSSPCRRRRRRPRRARAPPGQEGRRTKMPRRRGRRDFGSIKVDGTPTEPRFSAVWWEGGRQRRKRGFTKRTDAEAFLARVRVELDDGTRRVGDPIVTPGVTVKHAIEGYGKHLT